MARKKTYNDITEDKYLEAINWLENGGTKKGACQILGVSSNPTMERLINEYIEGKERDKRLRAEKRKTAISDNEVVEWVTSYLNGASLVDLSNTYYRSADVIKDRLDKAGALLRNQEKIDPLAPPMLPEACVADTFEVGQYVWSAKYGCLAQVMRCVKEDVYRIQVIGNGRQESAYQPSWELGCLKHLEKIGVKLTAFADYMEGDEVKITLNQTMREANKRTK